jgi:acetyltransferase
VVNYNGVFFQDDSRKLVKTIKEACIELQKPVALCVVTSEEEWRLNRRNHPGFPMFTDPEEAARGLAISRDFCTRRLSTFAEAETFAVDEQEPLAILTAAKSRQAQQLTTAEAFQILSCYSIPVAPWAKVSGAREASARAATLGFPVAMKVMGEQFIHKSDVGGVLLDLKSKAEVEKAYQHLTTLIEKTDPGVKEQSI